MLCDSMMPAPALPAMGEALATLAHELRDPLASIVLTRGTTTQWHGASSSSSPHVGDIAQWDANVNLAGGAGHVAYVAAVNSDGTIKVYEYNWIDSYDGYVGHRLSIRTISAGTPSRYLRF